VKHLSVIAEGTGGGGIKMYEKHKQTTKAKNCKFTSAYYNSEQVKGYISTCMQSLFSKEVCI
jgi:hypothetical protein